LIPSLTQTFRISKIWPNCPVVEMIGLLSSNLRRGCGLSGTSFFFHPLLLVPFAQYLKEAG
jgi:hypothetical protein